MSGEAACEASETGADTQSTDRGAGAPLELADADGTRHLVPFALGARLYPYQQDGVRWLFGAVTGAHLSGCYGGLLGDDTGLGKTLQAITVVATLVTRGLASRVIVCAPANLVMVWSNEFAKWVPGGGLNVVTAGTGGVHTATALQQLLATAAPAHLILIIGYEQVRQNARRFASSRVDLLLMDEAHKLKNTESEVSCAVYGISAARRLCITATPFSNNIWELFGVLAQICPNLIDRSAFETFVARPIEVGQGTAAAAAAWDILHGLFGVATAGGGGSCGKLQLRRTNRELRRGLPPSKTFIIVHGLSAPQSALYLKICARELAADSVSSNGFKRLLLLRTGCSELQSLRSKAEARPSLAMEVKIWPRAPGNRLLLSGKLQVAARLLEGILEMNERAVVASFEQAPLELLRAWLRHKYGTHAVVVINGSIKAARRDRLCSLLNDLSSSCRVALLSTSLAAGLTLVGANHLLLLSPQWNPMEDKQVLGRIHRPGQTRPCFHYRLAASGTVEESVLLRQFGKLDVLRMLQEGRAPRADTDDGRELFSLADTSRLTAHFDQAAGSVRMVAVGDDDGSTVAEPEGPEWARCDLSDDDVPPALRALSGAFGQEWAPPQARVDDDDAAPPELLDDNSAVVDSAAVAEAEDHSCADEGGSTRGIWPLLSAVFCACDTAESETVQTEMST